LCQGLSKINDPNIIRNYHPDYHNENCNVFFILKHGRYAQGHGRYYVLEDQGRYVGSAGWNEYDLDSTVALALTRMYTDPYYRGNYVIANEILPRCLSETQQYQKVWLTMGQHNMSMYNWFVRSAAGQSSGLFNNWPDIYKKFHPIGQKNIYYTPQWVVEYQRN